MRVSNTIIISFFLVLCTFYRQLKRDRKPRSVYNNKGKYLSNPIRGSNTIKFNFNFYCCYYFCFDCIYMIVANILFSSRSLLVDFYISNKTTTEAAVTVFIILKIYFGWTTFLSLVLFYAIYMVTSSIIYFKI